MFIYKITVIPINKIYIGFDTKPVYKKSRWKDHCKESKKDNPKRKLHIAMKKYGLENCIYEVIDDSFDSIGKLAIAEIKYIEEFNSYKDGLNSSRGGDGFGRHGLKKLTEEEILLIKEALGNSFSEYNKKKWANTTPEQRKEMVKNAFTEEVNKQRRESLLEFYRINPDIAKIKGNAIKEWQKNNRELLCETNRKNGLKGAKKVSKKIKIEFQDGTIKIYNSKSEFNKENGEIINAILRKTKENKTHRGFRGWEI